ncbi:hypothetical protein ASG70_03015 [Phycicoccus sp. Soil748]|nr:hypothetical protein ASG70_03015 [Phycicoccus sp. Soil748]
MVFVHNKRPWATTLSRVAEATMAATARFKDLEPVKVGWEQSLPNAATRTARGGRRTVMRFDPLGHAGAGARTLEAFLSCRGRRGLWYYGYPGDLTRAQLAQFDALFLFDMSDDDWNRVRSVVTLPVSAAEVLRSHLESRREGVLTVIHDLGQTGSTGLGQFPMVLPLSVGDVITRAPIGSSQHDIR